MKNLLLTSALALLAADTLAQAPEPKGLVSPPSRQAQERQIQSAPIATLTEEERNKLQEATSKLQREQNERYVEMTKIRRELDELSRQETLDEKAIREKAMEIGKLEGDLAIIRAKHRHELKEILPREHFERIQSGQALRPVVRQRLNRIVERTNPARARPLPPPQAAPKKD